MSGWVLDDLYQSTVYAGGENEAVMIDQDIGLKVSCKCDRIFTHWCLYNSDGKQGFLCPEPYTWMTNATHVGLPAEMTGLQVLSPGDEIKLESRIVVQEVD